MFVGREQELAKLRRSRAHQTVVEGGPGSGKSTLVAIAFPRAAWISLLDASTEAELFRRVQESLCPDLPLSSIEQTVTILNRESAVILDAVDQMGSALETLLENLRCKVILTQRRSRLRATLTLQPLSLESALRLWRDVERELPSEEVLAFLKDVERTPQLVRHHSRRTKVLGKLVYDLERATRDLAAILTPATYRAAVLLAHFPLGAPRALVNQLVSPESLDELESSGLLSFSTSGFALTRQARAALVSPTPNPEIMAEVLGFAETHGPLLIRSTLIEWLRLPQNPAQVRAALLLTELAQNSEEQALVKTALGIACEEEALEARRLVALAALERRAGAFIAAHEILDRCPPGFFVTLEKAHLLRREGKLTAANALYEQAASLAQGDREEAIARGELGRIAQSRGAYRNAQRHHAASAALAKRANDRVRATLERSLLARATHRAGAIREALSLHREVLLEWRALGHRRLESAERGHIGFCLHELGELDQAEAPLRDAAEGYAASGDRFLETILRALLARLYIDRGELAKAQLELEHAKLHQDGARLVYTLALLEAFLELEAGEPERAAAVLEPISELRIGAEMGLEALGPAYLAFLQGRQVAPLDVEHPGIRFASEVLAGRNRTPSPDLLRCSAEARRAWKLVQAPDIEALEDGSAFRKRHHSVCDLRRRVAPRRVLERLLRAHRNGEGLLSQEELFASGWRDEKMSDEAASKRLRTAIWTLRKLGFDALEGRDGGYQISPHMRIAFVSPEAFWAG